MPDYPKLRPIEAIPVKAQGRQMVMLRDPAQIAPDTVAVTPDIYFMLTLFDGEHSIRDIQAECTRAFGQLMFSDRIQQVIEEMDEHLLLESERFRSAQERVAEEFRRAEVRVATLAGGAYEDDPEALQAQVTGFVDGPGGPKQGGMEPVDGEVVGAIAPHIDFHRGGPTYAWCYEALRQACDADLFVILGTAHFGDAAAYVATNKSFETPLGVTRTDAEFLESLTERAGRDLFAEEILHKTEHSIELQVVFLQHVFADREVRIVPILCGGFDESVETGTAPRDLPEIAAFLRALRATLAECGHRACVLVGADLTHIGQRFGDRERLSQAAVQRAAQQDEEMLERVVACDADGLFAHIHADANRRRICGFPSIYTLLSVLDGVTGRLLKYDFAVDTESQTAVSFASAIFTRPAA